MIFAILKIAIDLASAWIQVSCVNKALSLGIQCLIIYFHAPNWCISRHWHACYQKEPGPTTEKCNFNRLKLKICWGLSDTLHHLLAYVISMYRYWYNQSIQKPVRSWAGLTEQAYIPIEKIIRTSKQSASTSWQCNTSGNRHQPATYGDLCLKRNIEGTIWRWSCYSRIELLVPPLSDYLWPALHKLWTFCTNHCTILSNRQFFLFCFVS